MGVSTYSSGADVLVSRVAGSATTDVDGSVAGIFNEHICYLNSNQAAENLQSQLNKGDSIFITLGGAGTVNLFFQLTDTPVFS